MTSGRAIIRILLTLFALIVAAHPAKAGEWTFDGVERVVAISDIHGDYGAMVRTLTRVNILNDELIWSGGKTHLVIVGDILDRGPDSRQAMDLLIQLEAEADAAGGRVHVLIGNHENMNLIGDLRYVSREEYAAFAIDEEPADRNKWFTAYTKNRTNGDENAKSQRRNFDDQFPLGYFAHRRAFGSDGVYGSWLLAKPTLIVIDGTAFVHGGISPLIAEVGLSGVNETLQIETTDYVRQVEWLTANGLLLPTDTHKEALRLLDGLTTFLRTRDEIAVAIQAVTRLNESELQSDVGPLWYRGNTACSAVVEADMLDAALKVIGANRVVIGHTPTRGRQIFERYNGRVIEIDTGMLNNYYKGQGNALVISDGQLSVINESTEEPLLVVPRPRYVGRRGSGLGAEGVKRLLSNGHVLAEREDAGNRIVSVSNGEQLIDAVFIESTKEDFYPEVAAYRLDLLLGLDMVPIAVKRNLDGKDGTMQFLPTGMMSEARRLETGSGSFAMCPLPYQWDAMLVFDALIFNEARTTSTIKYDIPGWQLILVGHQQSFGTSKGRPKHLVYQALKVGNSWKDALTALTDQVLEDELGDVLDSRRLRALGVRRDNLGVWRNKHTNYR